MGSRYSVESVTAKVENRDFKGEWCCSDTGNFEVKIRENGKESDSHFVCKKEFDWKCNPSSKYELLVRRVGKGQFRTSNSIYTVPSQITNAKAVNKDGSIKVSWEESRNQLVHYYLDVFKDDLLIGDAVFVKLDCTYEITRNLVTPSSVYKFNIWARSINGNVDGDLICTHVTGGVLDMYYSITVTGKIVNVSYFRSDVVSSSEGLHTVSLAPGCDYVTAIEDVVTFPQSHALQHKKVWEKKSVKLTFILGEKPPGNVTLVHIITGQDLKELTPFEWKDARIFNERINKLNLDGMSIDDGYDTQSIVSSYERRNFMGACLGGKMETQFPFDRTDELNQEDMTTDNRYNTVPTAMELMVLLMRKENKIAFLAEVKTEAPRMDEQVKSKTKVGYKELASSLCVTINSKKGVEVNLNGENIKVHPPSHKLRFTHPKGFHARDFIIDMDAARSENHVLTCDITQDGEDIVQLPFEITEATPSDKRRPTLVQANWAAFDSHFKNAKVGKNRLKFGGTHNACASHDDYRQKENDRGDEQVTYTSESGGRRKNHRRRVT